MSRIFTATAIVAAAGLVSTSAANPTVLIQTTGSGANSAISGNAFGSLDRPVKNGTGSKWILLTRVNGTSQEALITGDASSVNLVALEGVTEVEPDRFWASIDRYADINEAGDWVHIGNLDGGATTDDEVVYRGTFDGSSISVAFREGQTIATGDVLGSANYGPTIADSGAVGFGWSSTASTSDVSYFLDDGARVVLRNGGSVAGAADPFSTAGFGGRNAFQATPDFTNWVVRGTLVNSSGPIVLVKDGAVVLAAGDTFDGRTISQINGEQNILEANGDWLTRVRFTDGTGGAIRNGALIAKSGDPVNGTVPGELWSEIPWTSSSDTTFFITAGDSNGNVVLGGFTDNLSPRDNAVWTYNGQEFLRSGDQLDLDNDGTLDNAYIFTSGFFSASPAGLGGFLADDGRFYTVVDIRDDLDNDLGQAFIVVETPGFATGCNPADLAAPFDQLTFADISAFLAAFAASDPAADLADPAGQFTFADISAFLAAFAAGCP